MLLPLKVLKLLLLLLLLLLQGLRGQEGGLLFVESCWLAGREEGKEAMMTMHPKQPMSRKVLRLLRRRCCSCCLLLQRGPTQASRNR